MPETVLPAWKRSLPNALTLSRVALAAVFFAILAVWRYDDSARAVRGEPDPWLWVACAVFVAAAVTDALDGHLARKWGVVSPFGRVMDPFADKVLVIGAFVMLGGPAFVHDRIRWPTSNLGGITGEALPGPEVVRQVVSHVLPWMVVVILARELLVTSIRGVFEARGVSFAATASGKWKMILQSVCIPLVLVLVNLPRLNDPVKKDWAWWTIEMVVWATVVVTVWSGWPYVARAVREREKLKDRAA